MKCPHCYSNDITRIWVKGRLLQNICRECNSKVGEPYIPEEKPIKTIKKVSLTGIYFQVYDKYGHTLMYSQNFENRDKALKEIKREMEKGKRDENAGPYSVILWPRETFVEGELFT